MALNRRDLLKGAIILPFMSKAVLGQKTTRSRKVIKPKRLAAGETIGIIAPASGAEPEKFDAASAMLESMGYKTKVGKYARGDNGIFSGTDKERLHDLMWAFTDKTIDAVWCIRGGDGAPRLLPDIDFDVIRRNPKIFVGYSDITSLHVAISNATGLVTFHGPGASSTFSDYTKPRVFDLLNGAATPYKIELADGNIDKGKQAPLYKTETITKGKCRGRLIGGNLSLLSALAGTPYALRDLKGKILFIEDVNERPYRIDRMLTQLRQSADLKSLAGVALGIFDGCEPPAGRWSQTVQDVVRDRLGDLGVPVVYGLSFGHIRDQCTFPVGIEAELDADAATLTLLEPAVV
ncbi:MAG: LD-carboxypeptidase [Pyrinomonadaceae bacterium]